MEILEKIRGNFGKKLNPGKIFRKLLKYFAEFLKHSHKENFQKILKNSKIFKNFRISLKKLLQFYQNIRKNLEGFKNINFNKK